MVIYNSEEVQRHCVMRDVLPSNAEEYLATNDGASETKKLFFFKLV